MQNTSDAVNLSSVNFTGSIVAQDESKSNFKLLGGYQQDFEISRFSSLLQPTKEKDKHICPNCGGHNFSIGAKGYRCWSNECLVKVPLFRLSFDSNGLAKTEAKPVLIRKGKATYLYEDGKRVERYVDSNGKKAFAPYERGTKGKTSTWLPYRWELISSSDKWLLGCEGEKAVEALIQVGRTAISWCGAGWGTVHEDAKNLYKQGLHGFIYLRDNDSTGVSKADKVVAAFRQSGIWVVVLNPSEFKPEYSNISGFDIADLLELEPVDAVLQWVDSQVLRSFELATRSGRSTSNRSTSNRSTSKSDTSKSKTDKAMQADWDYLQEKYVTCKSDRDKEVFKLAIAQQYNLSPYDVGRILSASHDDDSDSIGDEVARALVSRDIDLFDYLPEYLARALKLYCDSLKFNQATVLLALLTTVSSLHKPGSKAIVNDNFTTVPTLFSGIVAESGSKKSPLFREICKLPLRKIRNKDLSRYAEENLEYERLSDEEKEENHPPKSPPPMYCTDATGEGLSQFASDFPDKSIMLAIDELAGLFGSLNAYRGGRGSDKQDILSAYDGSGLSVLRATPGAIKREAEFIYLSILGTIQPDILKKIIGDNQDADGTFARFLFCRLPHIPCPLAPRSQTTRLSDLLAGVYENILDRPVTDLHLSDDAFDLFSEFYWECEVNSVQKATPIERNFWQKAEGLVARLAFNLEVLRNPMGANEISIDAVRGAIALVRFYLDELMALMVSIDPENRQAPHIVKLMEISLKRKAWISPRDIYTAISGKCRPNSQEVKSWMIEAERLGLGITEVSGRSIRFKANDDNDDKLMIKLSSSQTVTQQGIQRNDDNDDNDDKFPDFTVYPSKLSDTDNPDTLDEPISPHSDSLGEAEKATNYHHYHQYHQMPETEVQQGQDVMIDVSSSVSSLLPVPVVAEDKRFNIGEIVKFSGGNGIVNDVNGDYVLVSPLPSGDDVWMPAASCKPNPWFR